MVDVVGDAVTEPEVLSLAVLPVVSFLIENEVAPFEDHVSVEVPPLEIWLGDAERLQLTAPAADTVIVLLAYVALEG